MGRKKRYWAEVYVSPIIAGEKWTANVIKRSKVKKR